MMIRTLFAAGLFLLSSCSWDNDERFLPAWQGSWLLVDLPNGTRELIRVGETTVERTGLNMVALAPWEQSWWAVTGNRLSERDLFSGAELASWPLPGNGYTGLAAGLDHLFLSSADSAVWMFTRKNETWTEIPLSGPGNRVRARSDRAFVQTGARKVMIIQEQTRSIRDSVQFARNIESMQVDGEYSIMIESAEAQNRFRTRLSYHNANPLPLEQPISYEREWYSPIASARFGRELTGVLRQQNGCLEGYPELCGDQFWPIWAGGEVLVVARDSLFRYDIRTSRLLHQYGSWEGVLVDGFDHMAAEEE